MELLEHIRWRPGIGDPSMLGWVTVVAYAVAAIAALAAAGTKRSAYAPRGSCGLWLLVAGLMAFLCLNKQLDLQSLLTDVGRVVAQRQGWYDDRRRLQTLFAIDVLAVLVVAAVLLWLSFRDFWKTHLLLAAGLSFLTAFIGVRAISFHHVDAFLGARLLGMRMNGLLELGGIALVALAASRDVRAALSASAATVPRSRS